jgi:pyridoxamine 5'-phosphate oxidase
MIPPDEYTRAGLDPDLMADDPVDQFAAWFDEVVAAGVSEPNVMSLATATDGQPSVRSVLMKRFDKAGFVFYSNYESRKARQLAANPRAAVGFTWLDFHRQVRIEGPVEKVSAEESDAYFATRPRGAQLAAGISRQSEVIPNRASLDDAYTHAAEKFAGEEIPRPDYWGGYRLRGEVFEFWEGRPNRLHHRIRYRWESDTWVKEWLSP